MVEQAAGAKIHRNEHSNAHNAQLHGCFSPREQPHKQQPAAGGAAQQPQPATTGRKNRVTLQRTESSFGPRRQLTSRQAGTGTPAVRWTHGQTASFEEFTASMPEKSLLVLGKHNPIRTAAVVTISNKYFELFVLSMIVMNCITLAMYSHRPGFEDTGLGIFLAGTECYFLAVFALEMVLKIIAQGLVLAPGTYCRDGWNLLDAVVVVLGFVDLASIGNYTALRAVRVLRPLRTITKIKGLKVPVVTLLKALPMLSNVAVLCLFAFFMFGIIAVQLFAGVLQNRCAAADFTGAVLVSSSSSSSSSVYANVAYLVPYSNPNQMCSGFLAEEITWTPAANPSSDSSSLPVWSGSSRGGGWVCPTSPATDAPYGAFCARSGQNPNSGMTSFDNVLWAWLTIFQCITQEGWTDIMYAMQDAVSPWVLIYFVALIIFGSFFLVNLALAVLYLQFSKEFSVTPSASAGVTRSASFASGQGSQRHEHQLIEDVHAAAVAAEAAGRFQSRPTADILCMDDADELFEPGSNGTTSAGYESAHNSSNRGNKHAVVVADAAAGSSGTVIGGKVAACHATEVDWLPLEEAQPGTVVAEVTIGRPAAGLIPPQRGEGTAAAAAAPAVPSLKKQLQEMHDAAGTAWGAEGEMPQPLSSHRGSILKPWKQQQQAQQQPQPQQQQQQQHKQPALPLPAGAVMNRQQGVRRIPQRSSLPRLQSLVQPLSIAAVCCSPCWSRFGAGCQTIIQSGWFSLFNMAVILTNTAVMAATTYPENPAWSSASEIINVSFSLYFMLELLVKLTGLGPRRYIRDKMNQFDALVVVASLVEVVFWLLPGDDSSYSSLSVLRSARLLRVFKLARSWHELNRIITGIMRSFGQVVYLSLLLLLFAFVFALMGMQLFGYQFASCSVPRAQELCPPGLRMQDCPAYLDCFLPCDASQAFSWFPVPGSPYNNMAYCEQFPRNASLRAANTSSATAGSSQQTQYLAQVGKAVVPDSRFDNFGWAMLTVFQLMTTENWNNVMYNAMVATSPASALWFVAAIIIGNYILLNLFLAVLLENFGAASGGYGNSTLRSSSNGSTLAAAANAALVIDWMRELLDRSYIARLVCCHSNKVHVLNEDGDDYDTGTDEWQSDSGNVQHFGADTGCCSGKAVAALPTGVVGLAAVDASLKQAKGSIVRGQSQHERSICGRQMTEVLNSELHAEASGFVTVHALGFPGHAPASVTGLASDASVHGLAGRSSSFLQQLPPSFQPHRFSVLVVPPKGSSSNLNLRAGSETSMAGRVASVTRFSAVPNPGFAVEAAGKSCSALGTLLPEHMQLSLAASPTAGAHAAAASAEAAAAKPVILSGSCPASRSFGRAISAGVEQQQKLEQREGAPGSFDGGIHPSSRGTTAGTGIGGILDGAAWLEHVHQNTQEQDHQQQQHGACHAPLHGWACGVLGPDSRLRHMLALITTSKHFENVILLLILLSSISLALDMPGLDPDSAFKQVLTILDMVFVLLFALEALLKSLVKGFVVNGPDSYLRSPWNMLDFAIVIMGIVMMGMTLAGGDLHSLASLRALRTLRALRPLRVASRLEGMKVVVNSLFASLPPLGNVCLVCLLFYLIFGIMGVDLLAGTLYSCQDSQGNLYDADYVLPPGQFITRQWCEDRAVTVTSSAYHAGINVSIPAYTPADRQWVNPITNFDNVINAIVTLFSISTTELWVNTMYQCIAAVGTDQQPRDGNNPLLAIFFVVFIVFGGFFVLQLFVSVTIEKFAEMHQKSGRSVMMTTAQEEWLTIQRMMADINLKVQHQPPPNSGPWRATLFRAVMSDAFEFGVLAIIVVNVAILALTHANMSDAWQNFMSYSNLAFTAIFAAEAAVKLLALGIPQYCKDSWCRFDLFVVLVSIAGVALDLGTPTNVEFLPLLRALRVARIFRLIPKAEGLQTLLQTLLFSLPALGNIAAVLCLFFFIYAVIGMNLFGSVKWGQYLGRQANFSNVGIALLTLFRMVTGESWDGILQDCMINSGCIQLLQDFNATATTTATSAAAANSSNLDAAATLLPAGLWLSPGDDVLTQIPKELVANRCSPSPVVAVVYFCTFVLLCGLVLVNFVIGVIIDNMQNSNESADLPVNRAQLDQFVKVWSELDPQASQFIPVLDLATLIRELAPPLGVKGEPSQQQKVQAIIMSVEIPIRNNQVHFLETLHALAGRVAGTEVPEAEELKVHARMYPRLPSRDPSDHPKYIAAHFYAALYVQAAVRGFLRRHALRGAGLMSVAIRQQLYSKQGAGFRTFSRFSGAGNAIDKEEDCEESAIAAAAAACSSSGGGSAAAAAAARGSGGGVVGHPQHRGCA